MYNHTRFRNRPPPRVVFRNPPLRMEQIDSQWSPAARRGPGGKRPAPPTVIVHRKRAERTAGPKRRRRRRRRAISRARLPFLNFKSGSSSELSAIAASVVAFVSLFCGCEKSTRMHAAHHRLERIPQTGVTYRTKREKRLRRADRDN